ARRRVVRAREARFHGRQVLTVHGVADGRRPGAGIREHDDRRRPLGRRLALQEGTGRILIAKIGAGVGTSHTPVIGAALDLGKVGQPYWAPVFKGYEFSKQWMAETKPDV